MDTEKLVDLVKGQPATCPKCGERLSFEMVAKAMAESRMAFSLTPAKGEKMDLRSVSESAMHLNKLLVAIGKELGTKATVLVDSMETREDGELRFNLLITRTGKPLGK